MKKLMAILLALPSVGCAYFGDRARDFGDCFRLEVGVGVGVQADATVGEFAHVGVGSSWRWTGGLRYGDIVGERRVEDQFPLSYVWTLASSDQSSLHRLRWGDAQEAQHRCYGLLPGELHYGGYEKDPIHYFDLEVGVFAGVVGAQAGFSLGEFVDFVLGWFGVDIADDDGEKRARKSYWRRVPAPTPPSTPGPASVP